MEKNDEIQRTWLAALRRLETSRRQGSSIVLNKAEVQVLLDGIGSFENELAQVRSDSGLPIPTLVDAPVVTS